MNRLLGIVSLLSGLALAVPSQAQFYFDTAEPITAAPGAGDHPNKPIPGALSVTSEAFYNQLGDHRRDRQAAHDNQICVAGCSARAGHTLRGPFSRRQAFRCGPFRNGLNQHNCGGHAYFTKPRCPATLEWRADAGVRTQRGYFNWIQDATRDSGRTGCWTPPPPPPPPPPPCSDGSSTTDVLVLPLDGRVSAMSGDVGQGTSLVEFETLGDENFFVNEYVVAEKDPRTGAYYPVLSSSEGAHVAEALDAVETRTPHRRVSPQRVLAVKVARHQPSSPLPAAEVRFHGPLYLTEEANSRDRRPLRTPDEPPLVDREESTKTWSFAVELDVRDALGLDRQSRVLWSEHSVSQDSLDRLYDSMAISFGGNDQHRVLVYAVVEVQQGELLVRTTAVVRPQCCCNGWFCV